MIEKKEYIIPDVDTVLISDTESVASGACAPEGSLPPEVCGAVAPTAVGDPMSS